MNIYKTPSTFAYAGNPVVWGFSGVPTTNLVFFQINLIDVSSNSTIFTARAFPTPRSPLVANLNLSEQLQSVVKSDVEIFTATTLNIGKPDNYRKYKINVIDYAVGEGELIPISTGLTSGEFYVYESKINNLQYTLDNEPPVMISGSTKRFLTLAPDYKKINQKSIEQLYFIQSGFTQLNAKVQVNSLTPNSYTLSGRSIPAVAAKTLVSFTQISTGQTTIQIINSTYGSKYIYSGTTTGSSLNTYTTNLVNNLNNSPLNTGATAFTATYITAGAFEVTAPSSLAASVVNGSPLYLVRFEPNGDPLGISTTHLFSGAIDSGYTFDNIQKIDITPKYLNLSPPLQKGDTMKVWIETTGGTRISTYRNYIYEDIDCGEEIINVIFSNSMGGVDTLQLKSPRLTNTINKSTIKKAGLTLDGEVGEEYIYEKSGGISTLQSEKVVYNSDVSTRLKAFTKALTNLESEYLTELFNSQNVYLSFASYNYLLPVTLLTTEQELKKTSYIKGQFIFYELEFEIPSNYYNLINNGCDTLIMNLEANKYCQIP